MDNNEQLKPCPGRLPANGGALESAKEWLRLIISWIGNPNRAIDRGAVRSAAWNALEEVQTAGERPALRDEEGLRKVIADIVEDHEGDRWDITDAIMAAVKEQLER